MARTSIFQTIRNQDGSRQQEPGTDGQLISYRATYQNKLRLVGMHLDNNNLNRAKIVEVPGGLLVRATGPDNVTDQLLEFPDDSFERYFEEAIIHRSDGRREHLKIKTDLVPTSYSDVMRAIGRCLDEWMARSILISEGIRGIYVSGLRLEDTSYQSRYAPFDEMLSATEVDEILTSAHARRNTVRA
ncbi:MAG: hypothetical protein R3A46_02075 [Thermomicrobiales bacterium]